MAEAAAPVAPLEEPKNKQGVTAKKRWFPLESSPDVMNRYIRKLGVTGGAAFTDVFGLDDELLAMVPPPVTAVVFLYPISEATEASLKAAHAVTAEPVKVQPYYMKQTVSNACGTVGILHALGNAQGTTTFGSGSFLEKFFEKTKTMTPGEIAAVVETDSDLDAEQATAAAEGQTRNAALDAPVDLHFICFTEVGGVFWELDGRQPKPLNLGPCGEGQLLARAAARVKEYMALDPKSSNFSIVAMTAGEVDE